MSQETSSPRSSTTVESMWSHKEDEDALIEFDTEFVNVDEATLISLADAARVLEIKCLSTLCTLV